VPLKIPSSQMQHSLMKGRRFIRMTLLRKEIAELQAQDRILYSGNGHLREIALTFDDGPDPYYTPQILDVLDQYRIKATFFCVGRQAEAYPQIVRQVYGAGHVVGNHSWAHPDLGLLPAADILSELKHTCNALQEVTGSQPMFFRPPYGSLSIHVLSQACYLGVTTVMWNAGEEARDWSNPGVNFIIRRTLDLVCNGSIILMHDCGGDRSQTVAALPVIIQKLQDRGFQFVTIQQMVDALR
jgi:peptidoglycan/xylan/chitin deacetylase (PgdA/CDA1 family)